MNWLKPIRNVGRTLVGASLMLSLAPSTDALAETQRRPAYQCPPGYRHMAPSSPYYTSPSKPYSPGAPAVPNPDGSTSPPRPDGQTDDQQRTDPNQTDPQQQPQDTNQPQQDFTPTQDSSQANLSPGMNTPQLGRLDQANRLNLFDNMAASPMNKVWFGLQYSSGINTGLGGSKSFNAFLAGLSPANQDLYNDFFDDFNSQQKQINYRVGAEVLLTCDTSIAVQGQYYTNQTDDGEFGDDFSNPQIMVKHVLARDCDTVVSATLGLTPQTSIEQGDFDENTTKFYPGMLYYETLSPQLFTQGGFQFGIPVRNDQITTFDWSVSLGYWLYRDCNLNCCRCCNSGQITGIIPQVNLLGKHTVGDGTRNNAFGFNSAVVGFSPDPDDLLVPTFTGSLALYREPNDVLDLSVGTLIMVGCDIQVGVGYSFPVTSNETRENEFLSYVNYLF